MSDITLPLGLPLLIEAVVRIAQCGPREYMPMTRVAPECSAPARYFEPFLQQMRVDGLLEGLRGPEGGYRLAKRARHISIGDIYRSSRVYRRRRLGAAAWLDGGLSDWPTSEIGRQIYPLLDDIDKKMMAQLDAVSVKDLLDQITSAGDGRPVGRVARATEGRAL